MTRLLQTLAALTLTAGLAAALGGGSGQSARVHRLALPPAPAPPRVVGIDETEYQLTPSRTLVAAGKVRISVYNRGMDDHDLVVFDANRATLAKAELLPGASALLEPTLAPGAYAVVCSLFEGTPVSHEKLGMRFTLTVR